MTAAKNSIKIAVEDEDDFEEEIQNKPSGKKKIANGPKKNAKAEKKTIIKKTKTKKSSTVDPAIEIPKKVSIDLRESSQTMEKAAPETGVKKEPLGTGGININQAVTTAVKTDIKSGATTGVESKKEEEKRKVLQKIADHMGPESSIGSQKKQTLDPLGEAIGAANSVKDLVASTYKQDDPKDKKGVSNVDFIKTGERKKPIKLYKRIVWILLGLTLILAAAAFYYLFVKLTITIIPNQERISNNMIIDIYDESVSTTMAGKIKGRVMDVQVKSEGTYQATGEEVIGEEVVGKVNIINNYTKSQPLVATTRLLAPDGKIYRLKNTISVPVGGLENVEIYADQPSEETAIEPTKFTIPGLWAGLQDKIYAESKEKIVFQKRTKKYINQTDIDNSLKDLKQKLLKGAEQNIPAEIKDYEKLYKVTEDSIKTEVKAKVGDEADEFTANIEGTVIVVAFNRTQAQELAKQKFTITLPANKEIISFDTAGIIYSLNNINAQEKTAAVNVVFEGKVSLKEGSNIVEKDKILRLKKDQLNVYLSSLPDIAGYEVKFFPSFIQRVPKISDRITVNIKK